MPDITDDSETHDLTPEPEKGGKPDWLNSKLERGMRPPVADD